MTELLDDVDQIEAIGSFAIYNDGRVQTFASLGKSTVSMMGSCDLLKEFIRNEGIEG
jgi:hypothetical protein